MNCVVVCSSALQYLHCSSRWNAWRLRVLCGIMHYGCMRGVTDVHSGTVGWSYWHVSWTFCCLGSCFCIVFMFIGTCQHFLKWVLHPIVRDTASAVLFQICRSSCINCYIHTAGLQLDIKIWKNCKTNFTGQSYISFKLRMLCFLNKSLRKIRVSLPFLGSDGVSKSVLCALCLLHAYSWFAVEYKNLKKKLQN